MLFARWIRFPRRDGEIEREPTFFTAVVRQRNLLLVFFLHDGVQQSQYDFDCLPVKIFSFCVLSASKYYRGFSHPWSGAALLCDINTIH